MMDFYDVAKSRCTDPGVARIILRALELNEDRRKAFLRKLRRENMATMMLGTASLSLAIVVVVATVMGLLGIPCGQWSEPRSVLAHKAATGFIDRWLSLSDSDVNASMLVPSGRIYVSSAACDLLAWSGLALGGMGIALPLRRRKFSWLSALGLTLILLMMMTDVAVGTLLRLSRAPL
jgi:hypothetical protein